jgi:hypothetical protein
MNNEFISNKRKSSKLDHPMLILRQNEYMKNNWRKFFTCNDVSKIENRLKECQKTTLQFIDENEYDMYRYFAFI